MAKAATAPIMVLATDPAIAEMIRRRREGGPTRTVADIGHITARNLRIAGRTPGVVIGGTGFPIFMLLVFTASVGRVVDVGGDFSDYAQFLTPGMVMLGLLFASLHSGIAMVRDLQTGMLDRLRAMPIGRTSVLAGRILADGIIAAVQALLILAVGFGLGFRFQQELLAAVPFVVLPVVFASVWGWLAMAVAIRAGSAEVIQTAIAPFFLPLSFLSLVYIPESGFQTWAQPLVRANPLSHVIEAMRGLATGSNLSDHVVATLIWSGLLGFAFAAIALWALRDRRSG